MKLTELLTENYKDIEKKDILKTNSVDTSLALNLLLEKCEEFFSPVEGFSTESDRMYKYAKKLVRKLHFTKEDITHFSFHLEKFISEIFFGQVGLFISALINQDYEINKTVEKEITQSEKKSVIPYQEKSAIESQEKSIIKSQETYIIHTMVTEKYIDRIGYENNGANILVVGNVGDFTAHGMNNGTITVQGKAESHFGYFMQGGILTVERARCFLGCQMDNGKIYVNHAGGMVGHGMRAGEIHIEVDYASFGQEITGTIFYRGEKVRDSKRKKE